MLFHYLGNVSLNPVNDSIGMPSVQDFASPSESVPVVEDNQHDGMYLDQLHIPNDQWKAEIPTPKHTAALFLLTMQEKYRVSQKAIDFAVHSFSTITNNICESVKSSLLSWSDSTLADSCFHYEDPFSFLQTGFQQAKFYREEFGLVVSSPSLQHP